MKLANRFYVWAIVAIVSHSRVHLAAHEPIQANYDPFETPEGFYRSKIKPILDTMMPVLQTSFLQELKDFRLRLVIADISSLRRWLDDSGPGAPETERIQSLIERGVLEVVGTGMYLADTACPHYEDFILNFHVGAAYASSQLKTRSKTAWQVHPSGVATSYFYVASLFGVQHAVVENCNLGVLELLQKYGVDRFTLELPMGRELVVHIPDVISASIQPRETILRATPSQNSKLAVIDSGIGELSAQTQTNFLKKFFDSRSDLTMSTMVEYLMQFYSKDLELMNFSWDSLVPFERANELALTGHYTSKPNLKYRIRQATKVYRSFCNWALSYILKHGAWSVPISAISDRLIQMGEEVASLVEFHSITGVSERNVDVETYEKIKEMEEGIVGLLQDLKSSRFHMCESNAKIVETISCRDLNYRLKGGSPVEFFVINPAPTRQEFRVRIPVQQEKSDFVMEVHLSNESRIPAQMICFAQTNDCLLEFVVEVEPLDQFGPVSVRKIYSPEKNGQRGRLGSDQSKKGISESGPKAEGHSKIRPSPNK